MTWCLYLLASACCFAAVEQLTRGVKADDFIDAIRYTAVPIMLGQWFVFYGFRQAPSGLLAAAVYSLAIVVVRLAVTQAVGREPFGWLSCGGSVLMIGGALLIKADS